LDYNQLKFTLENTSSLKALRQQHAALTLSFLHQQFKQAERFTVNFQDLIDTLDTVLESVNAETPNSFPRPPREYLEHWARDLHLLRIYYGADDMLLADLTPEAERALRWLEELQQRPFVGTESRFLSIFATLREIVAESNDEPEQRLQYLRQQQEALQREIDEIIATGNVKRLNATQIRERFMQASENALRLLSDFAAVEQNFRDLAQIIQEASLQPNLQKGAVVGNVLDADEALENSDEGRSFRAFWQFLLSPAQKDELNRLLQAIYILPELDELQTSSALSGLTKRLLDAGQKVITSNQLLAQQLRRMLDERVIAESQRVRQLCAEIKQLAFQQAAHPPGEAFVLMETSPDVHLLWDRPLWSPAQENRFDNPVTLVAEEEINADLLNVLYTQFFVDQAQLEQRLSLLLERTDTVTLYEVLTAYPTEKGVAEVLTYLRIAVQNPYHQIDFTATESVEILLNDQQTKQRLRIPRTSFHRRPLI